MGTVYSCWKTSSSWGPARIGSDIRLQHYCKEVCLPLAVHEACLASLPLLSRFGVGAVLICSRCCLPPWGGVLDMQLLCLSLLSRTVAIHCLLSSAFWKFRSRARWSSPCRYTKATVCVLCRLQHSSLSVIQEGPVLSPVDLPTSCIREPVEGSC